jgi:hypothetical protein
MTITDSIDRPTTRALCSEATFLAAHDAFTLHGRPTWVSHATLEAIITAMRAEGRDELVHYAGASYRDAVAWQVCCAWLADPAQHESVLKSRALAIAAPGWALTPEDIRAANPGMR